MPVIIWGGLSKLILNIEDLIKENGQPVNYKPPVVPIFAFSFK